MQVIRVPQLDIDSVSKITTPFLLWKGTEEFLVWSTKVLVHT
jgi:hypothetical protein